MVEETLSGAVGCTLYSYRNQIVFYETKSQTKTLFKLYQMTIFFNFLEKEENIWTWWFLKTVRFLQRIQGCWFRKDVYIVSFSPFIICFNIVTTTRTQMVMHSVFCFFFLGVHSMEKMPTQRKHQQNLHYDELSQGMQVHTLSCM